MSPAVDITRLVEAVSAVARAPPLIPEDDKTRNIFYTKVGWFTKPDEFEELLDMEIHGFFDCPTILLDYKDSIDDYFFDILRSVGGWDISHRMDIGNLEKKKPLMPLQTMDARKRYASYWSSLVFFAVNVCSTGLGEYLVPSDEVRLLCSSLLLDFSLDTLLELLRLLTQEKIDGIRQSENIVPVFLRLTCLRKDFSLESPETVSQNGAKLIYLVQAVLYKCAEKSGNKSRYLEEHKYLLDPYKHFVFSFLAITTGLAQNVNMNAKALPSLVVVEPGVSVQVRGTKVEVNKLIHCYAQCLREVKRLIGILKLGVPFSVKLKDLVDNLSDQTENYCFHFGDQAMQREYEDAILKLVITDDSLSQRYIAESTATKIVWNHAAAKKYLELYDQLMENMILLVHLGSGMPARGTELSSYRVLNGKSSPRTVYILDDQVFFYCTYSKSNAMTGNVKAIVRFLDPEASQLVVDELVMIRPFAIVLASQLGLNEGNVCRSHYFVRNGGAVNEKSLRIVFAKYFSDYTDVQLTFGKFRHVVKYVTNTLKGKEYEDQDFESSDEETDFDTMQFGHSRRIANSKLRWPHYRA